MTIFDDFEVDRTTGNIRHTSGSSTYTVLEFHRYLQDLADDAAAAGDDELDITDVTPSERATDNIITLVNGFNIDDTASQFLYDGSITQDGGDTMYAGIVVVGIVESGTQIQCIQNNTVLTSFWSTGINADVTENIISRMLIKVKTGGAFINNGRLRFQAREYGDTYSEFALTAGEGNNVAAIFTADDLNNETASGTVAAWTITNTEGYNGIDVNADTVDEYYYSEWDPGIQSINDLYEYGKYLTRRGTSSTLYGLNGFLFRGITHSLSYDNEAGGPFTQNEVISWGTGATAGSGRLLAFDDNGATGDMWIQLLTGVAPVNNLQITGATSSATADVNGTPVQRTISQVNFLGSSTGTSLIGAYGVGVIQAVLTASDSLTDLTGTAVTPPNTVTFTVGGLVSGEDRVFVAPWDGTTVDGQGNPVPDVGQLALSGSLTGAAVSSVVVSTSIPSDTPASGTIRVVNDDGYEVRLPYTSWAGSTFTLTGTFDFSGNNETESATTGNDVYITYIDKLATGTTETFTVLYNANRNLVVRVRDGGVSPIKTFITSAILTSAGGSTTAIRTSDA